MTSPDRLEGVIASLNAGTLVRLALPDKGILSVERQLPFLCVYRIRDDDKGTKRLITGEAAFCIVPPLPREESERLIRAVVEAQLHAFGAFLLLEVWSGAEVDDPTASGPATFRVQARRDESRVVAEVLASRLERLKMSVAPQVELVEGRPCPPEAPRLLPAAWGREHNVMCVGLEVAPIWRGPRGVIYPLTLRSLRHRLGQALRQTFFEFTRTRTPHRPAHHHILSPRAIVKAVWEVDQALEEVARSFSFLLQVTPVNAHEAWLAFKRSGYRKEPEFHYRPFPWDPALLKRKLFTIPLERVEDPTLAHLFQEKQHQLDTKISMLSYRRTPRFLYGSYQLYGKVDDSLVCGARAVLEALPGRGREKEPRRLDAEQFAWRARQEIEAYRALYPDFTARVEVRPDIGTGVMCDQGHLLVGDRTQVALSRVDALIQHEVGTHLVTYYNGQAQPLRQLSLGLADYVEFQEGIAVLCEYLAGGLSRPRMRLLAGRVLAVKLMSDGVPFVETYQILKEGYDFPSQVLFTLVMRVYRGGGLTKDAVYLRGLVSMLDYLTEGGDLEALFVGKIARHHVPLVKELQWRGVLREAPVRPLLLARPEAQDRLARLRRGTTLAELIG